MREEDQRNTPTSRTSGATRVAPRAARDTSLPFLRRSPETEDVHKGKRDDVRAGIECRGWRDNGFANDVRVSPADEGAGAASGERRCDTGHDDPGLQPADLLRRHTDQKEINVIPIKTAVAVHRTRIARKSGARQASFLARLGSALISKPVCDEVSPHEPGGNDPANAGEKGYQKTTVWRKTCSTTPQRRCQNCRSKNRPPSGPELRSPSTQRASRGQRALGGPPSACTWVWFHLETNMPKCRRANSRVSIVEPPEKCVSESDGVVASSTWWNLRRGAKLRGPEDQPSGREPCHEKSKGTGAAVG